MAAAPVVYILHGDDGLAINEYLRRLTDKLGDPGTAQLNLLEVHGDQAVLGEIETASLAAPFLAPRRLVVVRPLGKLAHPFPPLAGLLDRLPSTTGLVLVEPRVLPKDSALLKWASQNPDRSYVRAFEPPRGAALVRWIQQRAEQLGGHIDSTAAALLAEASAGDARTSAQELAKLLDFVDRARSVSTADIEALTPARGQADIFALVDSLGHRNGRLAMQQLTRLLEREEPRYIFAMVVRQFRLLLLAREALDGGRSPRETLGLAPFIADKIAGQAGNFPMPRLESIYRDLLEIDVASKRGQADLEVALDTLVVSLAR
jgi:DNA polymerase-3 subunit delta